METLALDEFGQVQGIVVDEEARPIANATVGVRGLDLLSFSSADGRFLLSPVPPGTHVLLFQRLGFEQASLKIEVLAGETIEVTFSMQSLPVVVAHAEVFGPYSGHMACALVTPNVPGFFEGITVDCSGVGTPAAKNDFKVLLEEPFEQIVGETKWQSTATASAKKLQTFMEDGAEGDMYCSGSDNSPIWFRYSREPAEQVCRDDIERETKPMPAVENVTLSTWLAYADVGNPASLRVVDAAWDQRFEMIATVFYEQKAPDDYSAFPESAAAFAFD